MKLKLAIGIVLFIGVSAAADAAPRATGISLGGILTPGINLVDSFGPLLTPVLQPVLKITGPIAGEVVASLHPTFVVLGSLPGESAVLAVIKLPPLPGLPK